MVKQNPDNQQDAQLSADEKAIEEHVEQLMGPPALEAEPSLGRPDKAPVEIKDETGPPQVVVIKPHADKDLAPMIDKLAGGETSPAAEAARAAAADSPETAGPEEFSDKLTEQAINDIAASDSDEVLKSEDEKLAAAFSGKPRSRWQRLVGWLRKPVVYRSLLAGTAALLVIVGLVPASRYFVLNAAGVRGSASLVILDDQTQLPLKNIEVNLAGQTARTDQDGVARFVKLKLGRTDLVVQKRAFAPLSHKITIGWGSNPLGEFGLTPVGAQYSFMVRDFLAETPLTKVEAVSGEASAFSNDEGKIVLTLEPEDDAEFTVDFVLDSYRTESLTITPDAQDEQVVAMVPAKKHVFVSKRSGRYDVYKIDADGRNEELLLAGSGSERDDMVLIQHPGEDLAALVSTRSGDRNDDGYLLSSLTLIDVASGETTDLGKSERFQLVDWIGPQLVYVRIIDGASKADPERHRLISYDYETGESRTLASSNYFNDVLAADGMIYYAPSAAYLETGEIGLFRVKADGSGRETIIDAEVWNLFRTAYDSLSISVGQNWYEHALSEAVARPLDGPPSAMRSRLYTDSPDRAGSLWTEDRDGKGVLLRYDTASRADLTVHEQSGLRTPIYWLNNDFVVFRVSNSSETADYVMSLRGGDPKKVRDVTNTGGLDRWYYY